MLHPESEAETNQQGLAYGSGLNEMGFRIYEKYVYENVLAQRKKAQLVNTSHERIIYQSDGNTETVDHVKGHDQPKSFATTNSQIRSKSWSLVFTLSADLVGPERNTLSATEWTTPKAYHTA
ncbi:hypothetical protein YC2023_060020 [Brassica napus]